MDLCGLLIDLESQILDQLSTAPIGRSLEIVYLGDPDLGTEWLESLGCYRVLAPGERSLRQESEGPELSDAEWWIGLNVAKEAEIDPRQNDLDGGSSYCL
ncbi:hypothetical protein PR002_g20782 [Phytophthora rubi]|uniref:Uncharacterized protein n=1 Tax=Phytophthora rubi TaxID=129364 RepID=A0A6A3JD87_9STRA|nr:hypothetical protein PR002_g20782 [Phytophthora rubi]